MIKKLLLVHFITPLWCFLELICLVEYWSNQWFGVRPHVYLEQQNVIAMIVFYSCVAFHIYMGWRWLTFADIRERLS